MGKGTIMKAKLIVHCAQCGKNVEGTDAYQIIGKHKWRLYADKLSGKRRKTVWCCPNCKTKLNSVSRIRVGAS
jgi:ribosomal protein L34E